MWAAIVSFFGGISGVSKLVEILSFWLKKVMPSTTDLIEDDKDKLKEEIANSDETGRP